MLERFKRDDDKGGSGSGAVATTTRTDAGDAQDARRDGRRPPRRPATHLHPRGRPAQERSTWHDDGPSAATERRSTAERADGQPTAAERAAARAERRERGPLTGDAMKTARARQREEFGGLNWGASFFGWLVAVGVGAIITGLLGRDGRGGRARRASTPPTSSRSGSAAASRCWPR